MEKVAFYDTKPYDRTWFDRLKGRYGIEIKYLENKLDKNTAILANDCRAVIAFVNDNVGKETVDALYDMGIEVLALRCAGFNNVDLKGADGKIRVFRVPAYSPSAVAEHAMALLLTLNRKTHKAYNRTREHNFSLQGLTGFDLKGKTVGIIGTGKVGQAFCEICSGFDMKIIAMDPYPVWGKGMEYVSFDELCRRADVISLHCPLNSKTYHILDRHSFHMMRDGVYIINTSRGALIDSEALLEAVKTGKVGGAGLDVYEEETDIFYEDVSGSIIQDDILNILLSLPNILVTSHQAFLTEEALQSIAEITLQNLRGFFDRGSNQNEISAEMAKV